MFARWKLGLLGPVVVLGMGCAHARLVEARGDGGGVVAIPDNTDSWPSRNRRHAEEIMRKQCPGGYVIEREGETVTGQVAHTNTNTSTHGVPLLTPIGLAPRVEDTQQTTSYQDVKEWRIWFRPKGAPPSEGLPGSVAPASYVVPAGGSRNGPPPT